jgi:dolichol-phosphate mannosyltransferase
MTTMLNKISTIPTELRAGWQVPAFETPMWRGRQSPWCVIIPVINEGERIRRLLVRMAELDIAAVADIIIVDGGSKDGSLELHALQAMKVRGLLVKTGVGKLSAQLRCGYAFALDQGYEGIVTIDGNDKDDPEAIPRFIDALKDGIDFVQASRFIHGGIAENTPKSRDFAIRFIHAPALSISSGFHWTDTTQGFRAYSRKMLLDPEVNPFRDRFSEYELLAYLSHRVPQLGFHCKEIATVRRYPKGEVPTKISAVRGNLKVLRTLLLACSGAYNASRPGTAGTSVEPIYWLMLLGFIISILSFFPGWMSNDSLLQYREARAGQFNDWHPVLMAWWWRKLDQLYAGPALFLMQNLLLYWGAWGLLANAARKEAGKWAYLLPLVGLWPALFFLLGEIWKDIAFACCLFMAWAILINAWYWERRPLAFERAALLFLIAYSLGVKPNGVLAVPFLIGFWLFVEGWRRGHFLGRALFALAATGLLLGIPAIVTKNVPVKHNSPIQYTQVYDLLAISAATNQNLLPRYINERAKLSLDELTKHYHVGDNNALFYGLTKDLTGLRAPTQQDLGELRSSWIRAIRQHPGIYLRHRMDNFLSLLRIGTTGAAYVANAVVVENEFGITFSANRISNWLSEQPERRPWIFYPWIYVLLLAFSSIVLLVSGRHRTLAVLMSASAFAFIAPHVFIAPASDFRYLYYVYFCSLILFVLAVAQGARVLLAHFLRSIRQ